MTADNLTSGQVVLGPQGDEQFVALLRRLQWLGRDDPFLLHVSRELLRLREELDRLRSHT